MEPTEYETIKKSFDEAFMVCDESSKEKRRGILDCIESLFTWFYTRDKRDLARMLRIAEVDHLTYAGKNPQSYKIRGEYRITTYMMIDGGWQNIAGTVILEGMTYDKLIRLVLNVLLMGYDNSIHSIRP